MPPPARPAAVRVGIVGGGIGGLTAAIALDGTGVEVDVYEATEAYRPAGAGILLASNALRALETLDLAEPVRTAGVVIDRLRVVDGAGRALRELDLTREARRLGQPYVYLYRPTLQRVLLDRLGEKRVRHGRTCVGVDGLASGGPTIRFDDGEGASHDVVVGADGLRSAVRGSGWSVTPRELGTVTYRGVAEKLPDLDRETHQVWGRGTRAGVAPLDGGRTHWFVTANEPTPNLDGTALREWLADRVDRFPTRHRRAVADTPPESVLATTLADVPPLDTWRRGRAVLLGDAAHAPLPYLGQGAAQAIADAVVLGRELGAAANGENPVRGGGTGRVERALASYERIRRAPANRVVWLSRVSGQLAQSNRWLVTGVQNGALRWVPRTLLWLPRRWLASGPT